MATVKPLYFVAFMFHDFACKFIIATLSKTLQ